MKDKNLFSIPEQFPDQFPSSYINDIQNWGNSPREELHQTISVMIDGKRKDVQKLLHLDVDFGNSCSLKCPHCFRRDDRFDKKPEEGFLSEQKLLFLIEEAKTLGLKTIKLLGRGETFENTRLIPFIEKLNNLEIGISIFTKGHVIGDDNLVEKFNGMHGIHTGEELAKKLKELNVSILLGFNSFNVDTQNKYIGGDKCSIKNYTQLRNRALKLLVDVGLNEYVEGKKTRLAMIAAPIKEENINEIFDIYTWGRRRNIYVVTSPSMNSGKGLDEIQKITNKEDYIQKLIDLYTKIYIWNIRNNIMSINDVEKDGISLYPGAHVCNQTATSMYLSLSGKVLMCPGRTDGDCTFTQDIRKERNLLLVWLKSKNYEKASGKAYNYQCPARDGISLPIDFYKQIKDNVITQSSNK